MNEKKDVLFEGCCRISFYFNWVSRNQTANHYGVRSWATAKASHWHSYGWCHLPSGSCVSSSLCLHCGCCTWRVCRSGLSGPAISQLKFYLLIPVGRFLSPLRDPHTSKLMSSSGDLKILAIAFTEKTFPSSSSLCPLFKGHCSIYLNEYLLSRSQQCSCQTRFCFFNATVLFANFFFKSDS